MKTIKTRIDKRSTYTYTDAMGKRHTLRPGIDPESGELITEEYIRLLHRMDDREVYNNVKNTRKPLEPWEEDIYSAWQADHPDEDYPTRLHISLDISDGDEEDSDKGIMADASMTLMEKEDPEIERLHEVVEMLRPDQQELYRRVVVEEEDCIVIAREMGVDKSAITHRMNTIKKFIAKNF